MKKRLQKIIAGVLIGIMLTSGAAFAKQMSERIDVLYNNIKIIIDGVEYTPTDVNGNTVEPFIYKGTTYLPLRAIANAFDKDVDWNGENYTVILNSNISKELDVNNGSVISPEASESSVPIALNSKEDIYALSRVLATDYARGKYYSVNPSLSLEDDVSRFKIPAGLTTDAEKIAYLQKASYRLENDVDVVLTQEYDATAWDPNAFIGIGSSNYPFKGKFNGNNKTISLSSNKGLSTTSMSVDYIGFFSQI